MKKEDDKKLNKQIILHLIFAIISLISLLVAIQAQKKHIEKTEKERIRPYYYYMP